MFIDILFTYVTCSEIWKTAELTVFSATYYDRNHSRVLLQEYLLKGEML